MAPSRVTCPVKAEGAAGVTGGVVVGLGGSGVALRVGVGDAVEVSWAIAVPASSAPTATTGSKSLVAETSA